MSELLLEHDMVEVVEDSMLLINKQSNILCEKLKSLLEQKSLSTLSGDYRTGKKLNMKKIIPYLASNYKKDKIWLRRSEPEDKDYRIMISIDDSLSMAEK